jgi:hypothetical protein
MKCTIGDKKLYRNITDNWLNRNNQIDSSFDLYAIRTIFKEVQVFQSDATSACSVINSGEASIGEGTLGECFQAIERVKA